MGGWSALFGSLAIQGKIPDVFRPSLNKGDGGVKLILYYLAVIKRA